MRPLSGLKQQQLKQQRQPQSHQYWRRPPRPSLVCQILSPLNFPLQGLDASSQGSLQDLPVHGTGLCPASGGLERQMTLTVVSSVRPAALLVHLVDRHAFPRPVGGQRRFCSLDCGRAGLLGVCASIGSAAARTVCGSGIAFATVANLSFSGRALGFVGRP